MSDYKAAHLAWIDRTKNFTPKYAQDYTVHYFDIMSQIYSRSDVSQSYAKMCYLEDKLWYKQTYAIEKEIDKEVNKVAPSIVNDFFVTIGFNHQTWSVAKCCKAIEKIINMEWIDSCKANFELHRENGEHPHVHFFIKTKEPKSKVLDKLWRPKYIQDLVLSKSFIDIKVGMDYHLKYINLDKQEDKTEYVLRDKDWRAKNNIPNYEKKWNR